jgi:hypothetical protein
VRSLRMLAFIILFSIFAATPQIGHWVTTASASPGPGAPGQEAVNQTDNDNDEDTEDCNSDNPRKQKKCHFNQPDVFDDNDNTADDQPLALSIGVSNADPNAGDTFSLTLHAIGDEVDQIWWWVPDVIVNADNGNDNDDEDLATTHTLYCDGLNDCTRSTDVTARNSGTITIHAKARDRDGRESGEVATEVRVH